MDSQNSISALAIVMTFFILIAIFIMSLIIARGLASHGGAMLVNATDRYARRGYNMAIRPVKATAKGAGNLAWDNTYGRHMSSMAKISREAEANAFKKNADGTLKTDFGSRLTRGLVNTGVAGAITKGVERQGAKFDARKKAVTDYKKELETELNKQKTAGAAELAGKYGEHTGSALESEIRRVNGGWTTRQIDDEKLKVEEARKTIAGLSKKDAEDIHDQLMKNVGAVIHMSAAQIQAIMSSDAYTDAEKETIRTTKYAEEIKIIGGTGPLTADQSARMNALGNKDLDLLRNEFVSNPNRAEDLNANQLGYILNTSDAYSAQEKMGMRNGRFAKIHAEMKKAHANPTQPNALTEELNKLSDEEAKLLSDEIVNDVEAIKSMPQRIVEQVKANPKVASATKDSIKTTRDAHLTSEAKKSVADASKILDREKPEHGAKLGGGFLTEKNTIHAMSVAHLPEIAKNLNSGERAIIRSEIETEGARLEADIATERQRWIDNEKSTRIPLALEQKRVALGLRNVSDIPKDEAWRIEDKITAELEKTAPVKPLTAEEKKLRAKYQWLTTTPGGIAF